MSERVKLMKNITDDKSELKNTIEEHIKNALKIFTDGDYGKASEEFIQAQNMLKNSGLSDLISICLSMYGMCEYLADKNTYKDALSRVNDGGYMADCSQNKSAVMFYQYALGTINFSEGNNDVAVLHYNNALEAAKENDGFDFINEIYLRLNQIRNGLDTSIQAKNDPLVSLVKIGRSINVLTDINVLLKVIAEETKNAVQADRCTVFMWDKEKDELWSKVALGMDDTEIRVPTEKGLAGYVVRTGESLNIKDAYNDPRFNPEVDKETGYRTKTILCMPIKNNNREIIGAFQVLNKVNGVFTQNDEDLLVAIGGSASIALENAQLFEQQKELYKEQKQLFESFIDTLATSIDARDKITAGHSTRVKLYSMLLVDELGLEQNVKDIIEKAAILHDIGKIGIRDSVLQKEGKLTDEEYKHIQEHVQITHNILEKINVSDKFKMITEIACSHHEKYDGTGYYRHLKGDEIPYGGRILAIADVFDAITSRRHYRDKMPINNVINILIKDSGTHFDKSLTDVFLKISLDKIIKVFLTENHNKFKSEDSDVLRKYNLADIYNFINNENSTDEEKKILELFNFYYSGREA